MPVGFVGKYLGYGTIQIYTGNDRDKLIFTGVNHATELKQKLEAKRVALKPNSIVDELTKLASLKKQGILTQEEFDKKKAQLLG